MKKQEFKKIRRGLGTYSTILNILTPKSIGVPEGEEEEQETENLLEKIMENFPNLAKEIDFQEVGKLRGSQRNWTQGSMMQILAVGSMCCDSNGQIHTDYRNPVEKKAWHSHSLKGRVPLILAWTGFYCFSSSITSRRVFIHHCQAVMLK